MKERTKLLLIIITFACAYYIPWDNPAIRQSGLEAFMMLQEYAREHVLTCLIPAFFIAGALMYFATLTEVPILQGLIGSRMGKGPALSLPSMEVLMGIIGAKKTMAYRYLRANAS